MMYVYVPNVDDMMVMCCVFLQGGRTALHCAAAGGDPNIINLILHRRPNMITRTDNVSKLIIQLQ